MIIAGFAGIGKSSLAAMNPEKYSDFVAIPYKYILEPEDQPEESREAKKADPFLPMHPCWPCNYLNALIHRNNDSRVLLIPSDYIVLGYLRMEDIPYILV